MAISDKILEYRQKNKLTQKELGELLNVSDKVISRWERGVTLPDVEMLKNISDELDISISELYDSIENSKDKYDYYKIWEFKKKSIISSFIVFFSIVMFILILGLNFNYPLGQTAEDVTRIILKIILVGSLCLSLSIEVLSIVKLLHFSNSKYHTDEYKKVIKKYGFIYLISLIGPFILLLLLYIFILIIG